MVHLTANDWNRDNNVYDQQGVVHLRANDWSRGNTACGQQGVVHLIINDWNRGYIVYGQQGVVHLRVNDWNGGYTAVCVSPKDQLLWQMPYSVWSEENDHCMDQCNNNDWGRGHTVCVWGPAFVQPVIETGAIIWVLSSRKLLTKRYPGVVFIFWQFRYQLSYYTAQLKWVFYFCKW